MHKKDCSVGYTLYAHLNKHTTICQEYYSISTYLK